MVSDASTIIRQRQLAIRRELDRRGIPLKQVQFDSGIPYATLLSYFPAEGSREPAMLPVCAFYALTAALPTDLLSLLLPEGFAIVRTPEGVDHDEIGAAMQRYLQIKAEAHHPESPGGRELAECEAERLDAKVAKIGGLVG